MRPTGLPFLPHIPWGTHLCQFYETPQDLLEVLLSYFKAGLENNERCVWLVARPLTTEQVRARLAEATPDLDARLARGQMEIVDSAIWYTPDGLSMPETLLAAWAGKVKVALSREFDGLRAAGDLSCMAEDQWDDVIRYEGTVNEHMDGSRILAICCYPQVRCTVSQIVDAVSTHQSVLVKRHDYWELVGNSERKQAEKALAQLNGDLRDTVRELEQRNTALCGFARAAAHDLRTPTRGIAVAAEWLLKDHGGAMGESGRQLAELIGQKATCLDRLLDRMLEYASLRRIREKQEDVDANALLAEVLGELSPAQGIQVQVEAPLPAITCERRHLKQVFVQLLRNAIQHVATPGGRVSVRCLETPEGLTFTVADNGSGIKREYIDRIFEPFHRLPGGHGTSSTGMGLALAKAAVELYGGGIWVESEVGRGSRFHFTLPKAASARKGESSCEANPACGG
jgi:signal transduction histidine kinase